MNNFQSTSEYANIFSLLTNVPDRHVFGTSVQVRKELDINDIRRIWM